MKKLSILIILMLFVLPAFGRRLDDFRSVRRFGSTGDKWTIYPGYEGTVRYVMEDYNDFIVCRGDDYTGLLFFDGSTFAYGAKWNYSPQYLYPLDVNTKAGIIAQTTTGGVCYLEYAPHPQNNGYTFKNVTPADFNGYAVQLHRTVVDCGPVAGLDINLMAQWKLDEPNGTIDTNSIVDSSGNGCHLTPTGPVSAIDSNDPPVFDKAADFNGTVYYTHTGTEIEPTGDFTVCFWLKPDDTVATKIILLKGTETSGRVIKNIYASGLSNKIGVRYEHATTDAYRLTNTTAETLIWHLFSVVYTTADANINVYRDGVLLTGGTRTTGVGALTSLVGQTSYIGGSPDGNNMDGKVDNLMFFNKALNTGEMKALYYTQNPDILRRVVFYWEYTANDYTANAWYSRCGGRSWTRLFDSNCSAVHHFHGGVFCPEVEPNGRLYVFTGDNDPNSSMLICDDIVDLLTNHETWYAQSHWALGGRTDWTPDGNYVLGWNSQIYRTLDIIDDGTYGWWIPDSSSASTEKVLRVKHSDKSIETVASYPAVRGVGWIGKKTESGDILYATASEVIGGVLGSGCDGYVRLYKINNGVKLLNSWIAASYNPYTNPVMMQANGTVYVQYMSEMNDIVFMAGARLEPYSIDMLGATYALPFIVKVGQYSGKSTDLIVSSMDNEVVDGTFDNCTGVDFTNWTEVNDANTDFTQEATIIEGGHSHSCKMVVRSGNSLPYIWQTIAAADLPKECYVTVKIKVRVASGADSGFCPQLNLKCNNMATEGGAPYDLRSTASNTFLADDQWHEIWMSQYIPTAIVTLQIKIYGNVTTAKAGTVYFSDVRIEKGAAYGYEHLD